MYLQILYFIWYVIIFIINIYYYNVPSIVKGETTNITEVDLRKIAEILDNILFKKYPLIETFFNYIKNICVIMNKADIPINWVTPNGLKIIQHYKKLNGRYKFKLANKVAILKEYSNLKLISDTLVNCTHV